MLVGPVAEAQGDELGAVVQSQRRRGPVERHQLLEERDDPAAGQRAAHLDRQALAIALVQDIQRAEHAAVVQRVAHEVDRPGLVEHRRGEQRYLRPARDPTLGPVGAIEAQRTVDTVHALGIPPLSEVVQPIEQFPKTPPRIELHLGVQV